MTNLFHSLHASWVIAKNSYKEIVRDKLLYGILLIAALVTASSFFLATVSLEQNSRVLQNIGLASIHLFAVFICVFVASTSINRDLERRVLYLLLPKPISRNQYVFGKFLGMLLLLATTLFVLGALFSVGSLLTDRSLLTGNLIVFGFSFLEIALLSALAILFATFTAPLNATLYSLALFFIGHSLTYVRQYLERFGSEFSHTLFTACYYLLPNLEKFDVRQAVLYNVAITPAQVGWALLYALVYITFLLGLAMAAMNAREV